MILRQHAANGTRSEAVYSDCGAYRYRLTRRWGTDAGPDADVVVAWVMLNPSTASEARNDPTIERCERRARATGFAGFSVVNLFAHRATRPRDLIAAPAPIGPDNDAILRAVCADAAQVICGWGVHGAHQGRGAQVAAMLRAQGVALWHLGLTNAGAPRHPLYVAYAVTPQLWAG